VKLLASLKLLLVAALALGAAAPVARKETRIALSTQLDRTAIWVGDTFHFTVRAIHDPAIEIVVDNLRKENLNLAPFVVRQVRVRQDNFGVNKTLTEITLLLTTYESGAAELKIPSFPLYYFTRTGSARAAGETAAESVPTPAAKIGLRSTLTADSLRLRDSRDIWQVTRLRWLIPVALGSLGLLLLTVQLIRRLWAKSHVDQPVKRRMSRRARRRMVREFMRHAETIGRDSPAEQQRYYGGVSEFVRRYLSESLEIEAASLTAEEIAAALEQLGQNGMSTPVKHILQRCEQVLYSPQGAQLGREWRDQVHSDLSKFAQIARH